MLNCRKRVMVKLMKFKLSTHEILWTQKLLILDIQRINVFLCLKSTYIDTRYFFVRCPSIFDFFCLQRTWSLFLVSLLSWYLFFSLLRSFSFLVSSLSICFFLLFLSLSLSFFYLGCLPLSSIPLFLRLIGRCFFLMHNFPLLSPKVAVLCIDSILSICEWQLTVLRCSGNWLTLVQSRTLPLLLFQFLGEHI